MSDMTSPVVVLPASAMVGDARPGSREAATARTRSSTATARCVGIVSRTDLLGRDATPTQDVAEYGSPDVITVEPDDPCRDRARADRGGGGRAPSGPRGWMSRRDVYSQRPAPNSVRSNSNSKSTRSVGGACRSNGAWRADPRTLAPPAPDACAGHVIASACRICSAHGPSPNLSSTTSEFSVPPVFPAWPYHKRNDRTVGVELVRLPRRAGRRQTQCQSSPGPRSTTRAATPVVGDSSEIGGCLRRCEGEVSRGRLRGAVLLGAAPIRRSPGCGCCRPGRTGQAGGRAQAAFGSRWPRRRRRRAARTSRCPAELDDGIVRTNRVPVDEADGQAVPIQLLAPA